MSTCARCGRQQSSAWPGTSGVNPSVCYVAVSKGTGEHDWVALTCRDRELRNLHSLLRSVTGKLEEALEDLAPGHNDREVSRARLLIDQVLEALS